MAFASLLGLLVVVGIGWFVARWKWREMVARNQEMRRRMALAAAEASKAELETAFSYPTYGSVWGSESVVEKPGLLSASAFSPARKVQYTCEVCGTPTITRCKKCKSVNYCSGKCQIVHWRQGHKDECSILSGQQKSGVRVHSYGQHMFSDSISQGLKENKGAEMGTAYSNRADMVAKVSFDSLSEVSAPSTTPSPAHDSGNRSEESNGTSRWSESMNLDAAKRISSERLSPTNPRNSNFSSMSDEKSLSSVSSERSLTGSEDHSLSELSTPSCGFWEESNDHENGQTNSSLHLSSNEKAKVFSHVIENINKEQKPVMHTFGHENEKDSITLEAKKCQVNKLELSESSRISYFNQEIMGQLGASNITRRGSSCTGDRVMDTYKGSLSYENFVKLYNWNEVELCPFGLVNCGNSCYVNAVLQCLVFTPPLTAYFLHGLHSKNCKKKEWCFSCEFEDLVKKARAGRYPVSPVRIMSKINTIGSHLVNGREEDAHEFLRYAIDSMQLACLRESGAKVPTHVDEKTTLLSFTFGGYLRSKIECIRCGCISEQHERMMDLAVEIGGDVYTLEDALFQFIRTEVLDGENKYLCSRCKSYEKAKKKLRVLEAPNVLTIALKRFQGGSKYGKLNKKVEYSEILDLAPYMSGTSDISPIYRLYGVVVHRDFAHSGHYLCYVQNNRRRWFEANDSMVQEVKLENVLSRDAYILFYMRCSPRSPRLIRSLVVNRKPKTSFDIDAWKLSGYLSKRNASSIGSDESSSEYSSSFFSDVGSYGTETSNGESASSCENLDQILAEFGSSWD